MIKYKINFTDRWSDSIVVKVISLHAADLGSTLDTPM